MIHSLSWINRGASTVFSQEDVSLPSHIKKCFNTIHAIHALVRIGFLNRKLWTSPTHLACGSVTYWGSKNFLSIRLAAQIVLIMRRLSHLIVKNYELKVAFHRLSLITHQAYPKSISWIRATYPKQKASKLNYVPDLLFHLALRIYSIFFAFIQCIQACLSLSLAYLEVMESLAYNTTTQLESSFVSLHFKEALDELSLHRELIIHEIANKEVIFNKILNWIGFSYNAKALSKFIKKTIDLTNGVQQSANRIFEPMRNPIRSMLYTSCYVVSGHAPLRLMPQMAKTPHQSVRQKAHGNDNSPYQTCKTKRWNSNGRFFSTFE